MAYENPPVDSDFWEVHCEPPPKTLHETSTGENLVKNLSPMKRQFLTEQLGEATFKDSAEILTRGDGWCGIYAILSTLVKVHPELKEMRYKEFREMLQPFLEKHGCTDENPSSIDADIICRSMRDFLQIVGLRDASFAFFSFDDQTVKFDRTLNRHPENLFCILYTEGHFTGLYLRESSRKTLFARLSTDFGY